MKRAVLIVLAVMIVVAFSGCTTMYGTGNGSLAYGDLKAQNAVGNLEVSKNVISIIHPSVLVIGTDYYTNLDKMVEPELSKMGASGVTDVKISNSYNFLSYVVSYFTGGLLQMANISVEGTAVK